MGWRYHAGALSALLVAAAVAAAPPSHSDTVLWLGGTRVDAVPEDFFGSPLTFLGGAYADDDFTPVDFPASLFNPSLGESVGAGVTNTVDRVATTARPLVVAGVSQGALVVQEVQALADGNPAIPSNTTFIMIANPNLGVVKGLHGVRIPILDYTPLPLPETRFTTVVVVNEYDPISDPVAHPWNALAGINAVLALAYIHPFAANADLAGVPDTNITTTVNSKGGTTTTYLVPTPQLPLTMPLRHIGVADEVVDDLDAVLRPVIDAGYARHRPPAAAKSLSGRPVTASGPRAGSSSPPAATGTSGRRSLPR